MHQQGACVQPSSLTRQLTSPLSQLAPEYESIELGIGESLLMKAIGESCGRTLAQVKAEYKKIGDLGEVAFNSRTRQKTLFKSKPLTVKGVFDELKKVAKTSGKDVRPVEPRLACPPIRRSS